MTDIVERLRKPTIGGPLLDEAADEIERLRALLQVNELARGQAIEWAKAALTAAAEVDDRVCSVKPMQEQPYGGLKITKPAAVEVHSGAQTGKTLTGNLNEVSFGENSESVLHYATIERCAQVADKYRKQYGYFVASDIAAAIRALKDEK